MSERKSAETADHQQVAPFADPEEIAEMARNSAEFAANMAAVAERATAVWSRFAEANADGKPMKADPLNLGPIVADLGARMMERPQDMADAMMRLWLQQAELMRRATLKLWGLKEDPMVVPAPGDKRFKDEDWSQHAVFDWVKQSYLLTSNWIMERVVSADDEMDLRTRRKLEFYTRNFLEAMSPANFAHTNPEVLRATFKERGENLARGLENMLKDLERGKGSLLIRQTDLEAFEIGRDMATTPGAVVFQNDILQLIQYAPTTETAHRTPLLFVPPWINKFYILDLNEKKSMVRWLVAQGWTVFVISWVNPDNRQKDETWESYMTKGVYQALDKALEESGAAKAHMVGYCIGGTMLGTALAHMAATGDDRAASATFFTTQLDFTDAGELQVFVDEHALKALDEKMEDGFLPAESMATAFNMLRASDLIWGFVISNYLLGKDPFPFDLLYWNADSTCMPGKVHRFYLDTFYNRNLLATGQLALAGRTLDLGAIRAPVYHIATREDHIAPPQSAYRGAKLVGSKDATFVLSGSGHIAGVVNPPAAKKYQFWTKKGLAEPDLEAWAHGAQETDGSWWPHWDAWLAKRGGGKVPARAPGARLGIIEAAPGGYVRVRFDSR